jgi:hypothetical protein
MMPAPITATRPRKSPNRSSAIDFTRTLRLIEDSSFDPGVSSRGTLRPCEDRQRQLARHVFSKEVAVFDRFGISDQLPEMTVKLLGFGR